MNPTLLFVCGAGTALVCVTAGTFLTLWALHVTRTGVSPIPRLPKINLFQRKPKDEDEPVTNGNRSPRMGP